MYMKNKYIFDLWNSILISQNTVVLINVWTLHNDKSHWGDPENFRPERFIRQNGQPSTDDWFVPFGLGKNY